MKSSKLNLKSFRVKSFITNLDEEKSQTLKGGATFDGTGICPGPAPTRNDASWCICK